MIRREVAIHTQPPSQGVREESCAGRSDQWTGLNAITVMRPNQQTGSHSSLLKGIR